MLQVLYLKSREKRRPSTSQGRHALQIQCWGWCYSVANTNVDAGSCRNCWYHRHSVPICHFGDRHSHCTSCLRLEGSLCSWWPVFSKPRFQKLLLLFPILRRKHSVCVKSWLLQLCLYGSAFCWPHTKCFWLLLTLTDTLPKPQRVPLNYYYSSVVLCDASTDASCNCNAAHAI